MTRITKSLVMIALVAALAVGATGAYFTDQETVAGNTFTAGKVDIDIRGACSSPQTFSNMAPGVWTAPCEYQIYNQNTPVSTLAVKYRFYDSKVSESVVNYYNKINVIVRHTHAGTPNPGSWPIVYQGQLKNLMVDSTSTSGIISTSLGVNNTHVYYMEFQLHSSTGNAYQSATATADFVFDATQTNNPGWSQ